MDNKELQEQLEAQQKALSLIYKSVEQTRKMILWSGIVTAVTFIIPLIIVVFMLPKMIGTLTGGINGTLGDGQSSTTSLQKVESLSDTLNSLKELGF